MRSSWRGPRSPTTAERGSKGWRVLLRAALRRWPFVVLGALLVLTSAATVPILSGRTSPPSHSRDAARRAVEWARRSGAAQWAADLLLEAERALRASLAEHRRQQGKLLVFRNFSGAREGFRGTESKARRAASEAERKREEARSSADLRIRDAQEALAVAETFAAAMPLRRPERLLLQSSRFHLAEARALHEDGNYLSAGARAEEATEEARRVHHRASSRASRYTDREQLRTWRKWIEQTAAWSRRTGKPAIVVLKEKNRLTLYVAGKPVRAYHADMGLSRLDPKLQAGDNATPEGKYHIVAKKDLGRSAYHRALLLNYPNEADAKRFRKAVRAGLLPRRSNPGELIEIHGEGGQGQDWTQGCVALSNEDMDDLFGRVGVDTPVTIVGGDGQSGTFSDLVRKYPPRAGSGSR